MIKDDVDQLVKSVLASAKYRHVAPTLVRAIGETELTKRRNRKAAIKATKNKLHQVVGAYWTATPSYAHWLADLHAANGDPAILRKICRSLLQQHTSTGERLPILDTFYTTIFSGLPPIHTVLDLACGLNPLTIPWMPLAPAATYYACDVDGEQMMFLQEALPLLGVQGKAALCNLLDLSHVPDAEVVLLLKTLPCLEQVDKQISERLLATISAPVVILSYPAQSIGGRDKGMIHTYRERFHSLHLPSSQQVEEFVFSTEIVFRIRRY